jgi:hypothetical protein
MKGGNTDSKASEIQGFDYENVGQYGSVDMTGGKKKKSKSTKSNSTKFSDFDFEKEWKEFEESYNQKYGGASKKKKSSSSTKKKPAKKASSSTKKKPAKKGAKKPTKRRTQRGGDESGATFAPAQMFDANATMSAPSNGPFQSAYGTISNNNLAPYPNATETQTGGSKKKGSKGKKPKTETKTTKPKKDAKKDTKKTGKKESVLEKIKKFFAM